MQVPCNNHKKQNEQHVHTPLERKNFAKSHYIKLLKYRIEIASSCSTKKCYWSMNHQNWASAPHKHQKIKNKKMNH